MRLTLGFAAMALLGLLAGGTVAATAIAPAADTQMTVTTNMSGDADSRASDVRNCVASARGRLPAGTSVDLFCGCAVDKERSEGVSAADGEVLCAAQMHMSGPVFRTGEIGECVSGAPGNLPDGTNANAFCTCAVDKMLAGTRQNEAIAQCATAMHITMPSTQDEDPDTNAMADNSVS